MALSPQEKIVVAAIIQRNLAIHQVMELKSFEGFNLARLDILANLNESYTGGCFDSRSDYMQAVRITESLKYNENPLNEYQRVTGCNDYTTYLAAVVNEYMTHTQEVENTYNNRPDGKFTIKAVTEIKGITSNLGAMRFFCEQPLAESLFTTNGIVTDNPDVVLQIATAVSTLQYRVSNWRTEWILGTLKIEKMRHK